MILGIGGLLVAAFIRAELGFDFDGVSDRIEEIPLGVGRALAGLKTKGPVVYLLHKDIRTNVFFTVIGYTSREDFIGWVERQGLKTGEWEDDMDLFDVQQVADLANERLGWNVDIRVKGDVVHIDDALGRLEWKYGPEFYGQYRCEDGLFALYGYALGERLRAAGQARRRFDADERN